MDKKTASILLEGMSEKELIGIIVKLANCSKTGEQWLLSYCKKNETSEKKQMIIAEKQLLSHWEKAEDIIDECNCYGGGPREDEGYEELYKMQNLINQSVVSWEIRRQIIDGMMEQFRIGNSGFEDLLVDVAVDFCKTKEESMYLAKLLEKYGGSYYRNYAANMYLQLGEGEDFERVQADHLIYGSDYIRLAEYYKEEKQDLKKAVSTVEAALKKADGRMDEVYTWLFEYYAESGEEEKIKNLYKAAQKKKTNLDTMLSLLYRYYKEKGDYEHQKEYLILMMEYCDGKEVRCWFETCRKELKPEDFEKNKKTLYEQLKKHNIKEYCEVLLEQGNEKEILNHLNERIPYDDYWALDYKHKFSRKLAGKFPMEIIKYYQKECEAYCAIGKDKNYQNAVAVLKDIKKVMKQNGLQEEWKIYFDEFKERHKRKRNLMKMIG